VKANEFKYKLQFTENTICHYYKDELVNILQAFVIYLEDHKKEMHCSVTKFNDIES